MDKKIFVLGFCFLLLFSFASAGNLKERISRGFDYRGELKEESIKEIGKINARVEKIPFFLRAIFGNEKINVTVEYDDGSRETLGVVTKNAKVAEVKRGELGNATMAAAVKEKTADEIRYAGDKAGEFVKRFSGGEISCQGISAASTIKSGILKAVMGFISVFQSPWPQA